MNKPSKIALALATAAVMASGAVSAQTVDNWRNPFGDVWKNGTNELCWRDNFWTPATGIPGCDGVPVAQSPVVAPQSAKVVLNADTFFDFDKATLKPAGRQVLDQVAAQATSLNLETLIAVGHTDSIGTTWSARAFLPTASTQKAKANRTRSLRTQLAKVAQRTVASRSKSSVHASNSCCPAASGVWLNG